MRVRQKCEVPKWGACGACAASLRWSSQWPELCGVSGLEVRGALAASIRYFRESRLERPLR
eukprot:8905137-Alexandrium_andersonii.AAC.1